MDPRLARAWADLAWRMTAQRLRHRRRSRGRKTRALSAAERAVALDPNDAGAHDVLGHVLGNLGKLKRAEAEFDRAMQLNLARGILTHYAGWEHVRAAGARADAATAPFGSTEISRWAGNFFAMPILCRSQQGRLAHRRGATAGNLTRFGWANRAMIYAARDSERRQRCKDALRISGLTIEGMINDPGNQRHRAQEAIETMRAADSSLRALAELKKASKPRRCLMRLA